ncbi:hypothetical protein [Massilibacterium senegalense]|uniref:hypothetical protein n=1 Tax=Massilibacterium senegalense TaxID=1632858 RepID=UPI000780833C|nr:hypothetical protein [Massilibacterium senegalense]
MTKRGFIYGTITGFLLGLIFYLIEKVMDIKLFTLLLNVDFIPILGTISFPGMWSFSSISLCPRQLRLPLFVSFTF